VGGPRRAQDAQARVALGKQRLDKWLFFARAVKSRTLAQKLIETGAVRVNSERTIHTDRQVGEGDVLTMAIHQRLMVWRIREPGSRRGPPAEAQALYEDLSPPVPPRVSEPAPFVAREVGAGRPTKKERRATDRLSGEE
jgi:ribosome-associated heat shock protein Hsp15